jgi:hypothetical protein
MIRVLNVADVREVFQYAMRFVIASRSPRKVLITNEALF